MSGVGRGRGIDFNSLVPPPNYVPGRGRGLGDTRRETIEAAAAAARAARREARLAAARGEEVVAQERLENGKTLEDESGMFDDDEFEEDDKEAEMIYGEVERRMEGRRKRQREEGVLKELEVYREKNPSISMQFKDVKKGLEMMSEKDWMDIPEIGDYSVKKQKLEKFTPMVDSLLDSARRENEKVVSVNPMVDGASTDLASIGAGRSSVLGHRLDRVGEGRSGTATVDPKGYLTELAGQQISSSSEIGDIKKARLLLKSVTATNPTHAPGWIAAARLEETAGKMKAARALAAEGCKRCQSNEDVWLEAARLYPPEDAKKVLANAVTYIPKSVKIWLQAAALENKIKMKRIILRKALEVIPLSARLWRKAVDLEDPDGARVLLTRAVECVPNAADLWLALAKLESYENAKKVLNRAREALPAEPAIWITGAKLEETNSGKQSPLIFSLLSKAVQALSQNLSIVSRDRWLSEAYEADRSGFPGTCHATIRASIRVDVEELDREAVWQADANSAENAESIESARALYHELVTNFPANENTWRNYVDFEGRKGTKESLEKVLESAVGRCPRAEVFWLMLAKQRWVGGDVEAARQVLNDAFAANSASEAIWLAAAKVENESGEFDRAHHLLRRARAQASSSQVYMKSALLERQLGDADEEKKLLEEGLDQNDKAAKLWLMLAQWHERNKTGRALDLYMQGLEKCGDCVALWVGAARVEEGGEGVSRARAILERGRLRNKGQDDCDILWLESVRLEVRNGVRAEASALIARGLQEHPKSGRLWAEAIRLEPRPRQRDKALTAISSCGHNAHVMAAVGRFFWQSQKMDKARSWFNKAVKLDPSLGDAWAILYAFEQSQENKEALVQVEEDVRKAEVRHGELWTRISKAVGNEGLDKVEILRRVSGKLRAND